ncbi:MAG: hypothetical protein QM504_01185 [Pseudomonadota bacterium]
MSYKSIQLMKIIGTPLCDAVEETREDEELYQFAFKNNIELLYLSKLKEENKLDKLEEEYNSLKEREKDTLNSINRLATVLKKHNIQYGITKTLRPYSGTPNDIDCLYLGPLDKYEDVGKILQNENYLLTAPNDMQYEFFDELADEKFSKLKSGGRFYIDFYRELAADHMPYMDSEVLMKHRIETPIEGHADTVTIFEMKHEMIILSLHSIIMHRIIPLEVIYTYSYYLSTMTNEDINQLWIDTVNNHAEIAMRTVLTTMKILYQEAYNTIPEKLELLLSLSGERKSEAKNFIDSEYHMPHIVNLSTFVTSVFGKLRSKRSRQGFLKELFHMLNPVFAVEVIYHMISKKYAIKHSEHV